MPTGFQNVNILPCYSCQYGYVIVLPHFKKYFKKRKFYNRSFVCSILVFLWNRPPGEHSLKANRLLLKFYL